MTNFAFVGRLPSSKSILNRLLIARDYCPGLDLRGESAADDVRLMQEGLASLHEGRPIACGAAGTTLRFLALRASRVPGRHVLTGQRRLFERPQDELVKVLAQLGVTARLGDAALEIEGDGWVPRGDTLHVPSARSSQFATAVLMNAWGLDFDLYVSLGGGRVSEGYWRMSVRLCERLGMKLEFWDADFRVARHARVTADAIDAEIDVSSAFALAAVAAVAGNAHLTDFPQDSLQPDAAFVDILNRMGVPISRDGTTLKIERAQSLSGVAVNLRNTPDLFPVLAALSALAHGESDLHGAPHLVHKESDRLGRIAALVQRLGRDVVIKPDGMVVRGSGPPAPGREPIEFDCDHDHRLAFAAAVLKSAGYPLIIRNPDVVTKSFPEYWRILGWAP